jgi:probable selenium-dependent hydroxylase accessory protein YqeC
MQFYQLISDKIEEARGSCIALLGGGGKTALLHKLADEFSKYYPSVLQTSLTKTAFHSSDKPLILNEINIDKLDSIKLDKNPLFIIGEKISDEKLKGISDTDLDRIRHQFDITIFECDGARNKPLKVHTEYDPVVPEFATHVIIIVGADVINTKISDGLVHRPELFCEMWNIIPDFQLDNDFIVNVLTSEEGYLSKILNNVEIVYFVNKWDGNQKNAKELALAIYKKTGKLTFYGSVQNNILKQVSK